MIVVMATSGNMVISRKINIVKRSNADIPSAINPIESMSFILVYDMCKYFLPVPRINQHPPTPPPAAAKANKINNKRPREINTQQKAMDGVALSNTEINAIFGY